MGKEKVEECNNVLTLLKEIKDAADAGFEQKIMYISAGAIAVAISALDKVEGTSSILLIIGICCLVATLILNTGYDLVQIIYIDIKGKQIHKTRTPHTEDIYNFDTLTKTINIIVLVLFMLGIVFLTSGAIYVINNN